MATIKTPAELQQALKDKHISRFRMFDKVANDAEPITSVGKPFFYKNSLTLAIGDPGVSKTTLSYALAVAFSEGKDFLGIHVEHPIKILILDFESGDSLIKAKYDAMGEGKEYPNIRIFNEIGLSINEILPDLDFLYNEFPFELVIVDNMGCAFNTQDENDNAEAIKHIKTIKELARKYDASVLMYHHPSKANMNGTRKGSGAFAWARYSDICLNLNALDNNIVEIEIAKHRLEEELESIYYQKMGEGLFERCDPPAGNPEVKKTTLYPVDRACTAILALKGHKKKAELNALTGALKCSEEVIKKAIDRLVRNGDIQRSSEYGYYDI